MGIFFVRRPVLAMVVALVILIAGGLALQALPIAQYPEIAPPTIQVQATYPGADAKTIADSIAIPIEQAVNGAENMIYMSSLCTNDGRYTLTCTFKVGADTDMANVDVNNRVSKAMSKLPQDAVSQGITVTKQSPSLLMVVSVYSPDKVYDDIFLSNYASIQMVDAITRTDGVGNSMIVGQRDYSMRLWVDPKKLSSLGLTAGDIANVVNQQNLLAPAGSIGQPPAKKGTEFQHTVNAEGRLVNVDQFENMVVRSAESGLILRMKDVARVELAAQQYYSFGRIDGVPSTLILVYQMPGANAIATSEKLKKLLSDMKPTMPPGLEYDVTLDTTEFVHDSINEVLKALRDAIILVLIVVLLFLGSFRATFIPMLAVPVSLVGTFMAFPVLGFSINTLTLFAIVLAVGIVVDDAIVVVEAAESHIERGLSPREATEQAMREVQGPVIAIALVLCAVFVPVAFMGGITGQLYRQFALTLSVSVLLSALMALTLTPALCSLILRPRTESKSLFNLFNKGFNKVFGFFTGLYVACVKGIIRFKFVFILILFVIWGSAAHIAMELPTGFVPNEDLGYFFVSLTLPDGASLDRTDQITKRAEEFIRKQHGIKHVLSMGGLCIMNSTYNSNTSTLICLLDDYKNRKTPDTSIKYILTKVQQEINKYPDVLGMAIVASPIPGLGNSGGFQFELQDTSAHSLVELDQMQNTFMAKLSQRPEIGSLFTGYRTTVPQFNLELDRDKASNMNIPISSVFQSLQIFLGGLPVNDFNLYDRTFKVMVQAEPDFTSTEDNIGNIYVRSNDGDMIPLSTLVKVTEEPGPSLVQRYNMFKTAEISGSAASGYSSGQALSAIEETAKEVLPKGYGYQWSGLSFQEKEAGSSQAIILVLAVVFVFLFLAAQYESWSIPFSVLCGLPIGIFGAFLAIFLVHANNNVYVQIGVVMLLGLAAKNAILIVEYAKEKYEKGGMSLFEATVEGAKIRFRPILMTSFAFILGVVPLVTATGAGAVSRRCLGTAVFGGMSAATCLGVFFIPLLYFVVQGMTDRFGKKKIESEHAASEIAGEKDNESDSTSACGEDSNNNAAPAETGKEEDTPDEAK